MKKLLFVLLAVISIGAKAQSTSIERDSVAQTQPFQVKVKMATHKAANNLLADPNQPERIRQYAQLIVSSPMGAEWLAALSYGCMTNVAVNWNSSDGDIEFTVNSLFAKYAYAYYRELPPVPEQAKVKGIESGNIKIGREAVAKQREADRFAAKMNAMASPPAVAWFISNDTAYSILNPVVKTKNIIPILTKTQRETLVAEEGLISIDSKTKEVLCYDGAKWVKAYKN